MKNRVLRVALTTALLAAGVAHADELELLERKVTRYATPYLNYYKNPCVCTVAPNAGMSGILRYAIAMPTITTRQVKVWCQVKGFTVDGDPDSTVACPTFVPLAG